MSIRIFNVVLPQWKQKLCICKFKFFRRKNHSNVKTNDLLVSAQSQTNISTLFVPGRYGNEMYQIVKPDIDVNYILKNIESISYSFKNRGIYFDSEHAVTIIKQWHSVRNYFLTLSEKEKFCSEEIKRLKATKNEFSDFIEQKEHLIDCIKLEKNKLLDIEDCAMPIFQKIPATLDPKTPTKYNVSKVVIETSDTDSNHLSHSELGSILSVLEFHNCLMYFLSGKLGILDLAVQIYFSNELKKLHFSPLSCADFCKSFIVEAIGLDPYSNEDSIPLQSKTPREIAQKLHLCGSASFEAFCAYLTNMNISKSTLPLKYFSVGRCYNAKNRNSAKKNLFSVVQSTNIHCLILSELSSNNEEFDALFAEISAIYKNLKIPFQIVDVSAQNLNVAECRKKQIELWSPALKQYIPVSYLSQRSDFVSKRLHITYGMQHIIEGYCNIIEGVILNTPILLGCIMENLQSKNDFDIPDVLKSYVSELNCAENK